MRETDDEAMRAGDIYIYVDTALTECGEMIEPLRPGANSTSEIKGDLAAKFGKTVPGQINDNSITYSKLLAQLWKIWRPLL